MKLLMNTCPHLAFGTFWAAALHSAMKALSLSYHHSWYVIGQGWRKVKGRKVFEALLGTQGVNDNTECEFGLRSPISHFHFPTLSFPGWGSKVLKRSVSQRWPCLPHRAVVGTEWNTGISQCLVEGPHHTRELLSLLCARNFIHTTFCMSRLPHLWNEDKG